MSRNVWGSIVKLTGYEDGQFPVWRTLMLGYISGLEDKEKEVAKSILMSVDARQERERKLAAALQSTADARKEAETTLAEIARVDAVAKAHLLLFISPEIADMYVDLESGWAMW
jgi:hypothetical protein